nr:MAG TPA: hypothetical protein [Caudoviricetes sp.]
MFINAWPLLSSSDAVFVSPSAGARQGKGRKPCQSKTVISVPATRSGGALCYAFEE